MTKDFKKFLTESELKLDPSMRVGDTLRLNINAKQVVEMRITDISNGKVTVEAAKPDYLDFDKDGDKDEPMTKALKDKEEVDEGYTVQKAKVEKNKDSDYGKDANIHHYDVIHNKSGKKVGTVQKGLFGAKLHIGDRAGYDLGGGDIQAAVNKSLSNPSVRKKFNLEDSEQFEEGMFDKFKKRMKAKRELKDLDADSEFYRQGGLMVVPDERKAARLHNVLNPNKPKRKLPSTNDEFDEFGNYKSDMNEADDEMSNTLARIAQSGDFDELYDLMSSNTPAGKYVQNLYSEIAREHHLHPDDDFEQIFDRIMDALNSAYGSNTNEAINDILKLSGVKPVKEAMGKNLSVDQLAAISSKALDDAYHYGVSSPGNTFGWQASIMSATYAKKMIEAGVTDIEKISDAIHKGWNVTAEKFVKNPMVFDDSKTMDPEKLKAKQEQRAKLMKINYAQLPEDEKEKDRVVARAVLQALTGKAGEPEAKPAAPASNVAEEQNKRTESKKATEWMSDPALENQVSSLEAFDVYLTDPKKGWKGYDHCYQNADCTTATNPMYFKDFLRYVIKQNGPNAIVTAVTNRMANGLNESSLFAAILKNAGLKTVTESDLNAKPKLNEGTMAHGIFDRDPKQAMMAIKQLETMLKGSRPLTKETAGDKLYGLVFDDELFDLIDEVDPGMDIRKHFSTMERLEELLQYAKEDLQQSNVKEGWDDYGQEDTTEAAKNAILRRIRMQHLDLIKQYGLDKVMDAVEDQASMLDNLDEIGSSDVSAWVNNIKRMLDQSTKSFEMNEGKIVVDNKAYDLTLNNDKRTWTANIWTSKKVF